MNFTSCMTLIVCVVSVLCVCVLPSVLLFYFNCLHLLRIKVLISCNNHSLCFYLAYGCMRYRLSLVLSLDVNFVTSCTDYIDLVPKFMFYCMIFALYMMSP